MEQTIDNAPKEVKREILTNSDYLDVADKLPWATMAHYKLWFTGKIKTWIGYTLRMTIC